MHATDSRPTSGRVWARTIAAAAAIAVFSYAILYYPERDDETGALISAAATFIAATLGLAAAERSRVLPNRSLPEHARLAGLTVLIGVALGTANLLANFALAQLDQGIQDWMVRKWSASSDWSMVVTAPVTEEVTFRLLVLSGAAWLLGRFMHDRQRIFVVALIASALLFGPLHILDPAPVTGATAVAHATGVVLKSSSAGLLFGWVFWRWGLPYSIACHSVTNATHIILAPFLFDLG
jgi:membrane protease YdiL (CAAX protease family)